jgi:hypothetical protein
MMVVVMSAMRMRMTVTLMPMMVMSSHCLSLSWFESPRNL